MLMISFIFNLSNYAFFSTYRVPVKENIKKETMKKGKQVSLDGKQIQKLKGRITRSNSVPSIFCPALNQLRGKNFYRFFVLVCVL